MAINEAWCRAKKIAENPQLPWESLNSSTMVVTGSTGLIGSHLVRALIERAIHHDDEIKLILPVRNIEKARRMFGEKRNIEYVHWLMGESLPDFIEGDIFVHAACPTASADFLHRPVEVISDIVKSTESVIELLRKKQFRRCIYLSTMEVYGDLVGRAREDINGSIDVMNPRSSYPEAKRLSECMFASAAAEYGISISVLRLAQTFGIGVPQNDNRVFAEFGRSVSNGNHIVLLSDGSKQNPYLSVDDAVSAIIFLIAHGEEGEAYNVANPATFCSILDMAKLVTQKFGEDHISVFFGEDKDREKSFRPGAVLDLDCAKLFQLGWSPTDSLDDMYTAMFAGWANNE